MPEQIVLITEQEANQRNMILRRHKFYKQFRLLFWTFISYGLVYLIQKYIEIGQEATYIAFTGVTILTGFRILRYCRKIRPINLDMKSSEKIVTTGRIVFNNTLHASSFDMLNLDDSTASFDMPLDVQKEITFDVDGKLLQFNPTDIALVWQNYFTLKTPEANKTYRMELTIHSRKLIKLEEI